MANTIIELRRSNASGNVPTSLANGEIAINTYDGKLFYRGGVSNTIQTIERFQGPAGLNQEIQFNDSGVLGSDSGLTYNKTTDVLTVVGGAIVGGVNVTPQIQFAFTQANSAFIAANSAGVYANGAFAAANAATATDTTQNNSIIAAFTRANNSLNANTGGTVTGDLTIGTGAGGVIAGANVIYSNVFVANSNGYIQFSDGSRQFTANSGTDTFARNQSNAAFASANSAGVYANGAFAAANAATATDTTQNNSITAAFAAANSSGSYANSAFLVANSAASINISDYFPTGDYGNLTDSSTSAFGESLIITYDCRIDPINPNGLFLTKDFGLLT